MKLDGVDEVNLKRRKNFGTAAKVLGASAIVPLATFSPPAHAIWQEVARGIAAGFAEFFSQAFEALTDVWTNSQKEGDDKEAAAKAKSADNKLDFRVQLENMTRINKIKPIASHCEKEDQDVSHHSAVESEISKQGNIDAAESVALNNESPRNLNKGMAYFGVTNGKFNPITALDKIKDTIAKSDNDEAGDLTLAENIALTKVLTGTSGARASEPIKKINANRAMLDSPVIKYELSGAMLNTAAIAFATKMMSEQSGISDNSRVASQQAERKSLKKIKNRYSDESFHAETNDSLNEVAIAAQTMLLIGESVFVMNARYKQNEKIIALLAMQILAMEEK